MALTPCDLADLLSDHGYLVDYDTGEVDQYKNDPNKDRTFLILLAAMNKLDVQYLDGIWAFFIPDLNISDMESYCKAYPNDQQCKCYDV